MERTILITGCSSGIGLDAARGLKARGWRVFATCRQEPDCERLRASASPAPRVALDVPFSSTAPAAERDVRDARAWGVAYVIEGSRLGGQVLYRRLAEPLAPHPLRYLQGAGGQTGARWRAFLESLRAALDTPARIQAACDGAAWAFERLLQLSRRACPLQERAA